MEERDSSPEATARSATGGIRGTRRVLLVAGPAQLESFPLEPGTFVVGRAADCDVSLDHPKISRQHLKIFVGDRVEVEDLGSTNGTRLADTALKEGERAVLEDGHNLEFGPFMAVVLERAGGTSPDEPSRAAIAITNPLPAGIPDVVRRVAAGTASILVTGETGVGKEILARTLHELSGRRGELVAINCASLTDSLVESELFGHERGAFTGAGSAKPGLFEVAAGGTVFLDEIGELPPTLQAKLLRVVETRTVYRIGGVKPITLDVRFLAATHRDLLDEVHRGTFRRDLYFRINGLTLTIPPLRKRRSAIPILARELLAKIAGPGVVPPRISMPALQALFRHDWPGNVRELRAVMERAAVICAGQEIRVSHLLFDDPKSPEPAPVPQADRLPRGPSAPPLEAARGTDDEQAEKARIIAALSACAGNQTHAARRLGISRNTLISRIIYHRIPRPRNHRG